MANFPGKDGIVRIGTYTVGSLTDWTLTIDTVRVDLRTLGDTWKTSIQGGKSWSGSASAIFDVLDTNGQKVLIDEVLTGDGILASQMLFYVCDGATRDGYMSGSAILVGMDVKNPGNDDVLRATFNIEGTGALSYTAPV